MNFAKAARHGGRWNTARAYSTLQKKPDYSLLLVSGLEKEKMDNFNSMFKIRMMNEKKLLPYLAGLFQAKK